jgi:hypothetical protein
VAITQSGRKERRMATSSRAISATLQRVVAKVAAGSRSDVAVAVTATGRISPA